MKKSKVVAVQSSGTWEGSYGVMYKFEVTLENGDTGEYSGKSKEQTKFVIDSEVEYTITEGKFPKIKPIYTPSAAAGGNWTPNPERDLKIVKQTCLKAAVELCNNDKITLAALLTTADKLVLWVNGTEAPKDEYTKVAKAPKKETTDLPF
jgi:hypothetical protein|tara:strand:+ start:50 stop:499 length:450 start_codon:yes stop_codon:yes gene_type:complete